MLSLAVQRQIKLRVGAGSHRGRVRTENQDRISRFRCPLGEVFAVVDGMGGHLDGSRAAEATIAVLEEQLNELPSAARSEVALRHAVEVANRELYRLSSAAGGPSGARMGATLVLALFRCSKTFIAHAGDSRAYLLRDRILKPLTRDHTLVQQMVDHQVLSEEEARLHPDAGVVTRAVGQQEKIELEVAEPFELQVGDQLALCSDGLCGYADDTAIQRVLVVAADVQEATDRLIELALAAGGEDNVSVQVVQVAQIDEVEEVEEKQAPPQRTSSMKPPRPDLPRPAGRQTPRHPRLGLTALAIAVLVVALLIVGFNWPFG